MAEKERSSIPESWAWKQLDEVAEINPTLDRDQIEEDISVSFVPMKRVEELSGHIDLSETRPISEVASRYTYFAEGDVIFAKITPCMENGKTAIAEGLENGVGFGSTEFHVVRPSDDLLDSWAFYYLIQEGFRRDAKRRMTGSAGQKRVPTGYMEKIQLPVPPLSEQGRIVAKIEELFSELEAGVADLKRAKKQLQRYRQSVLQAAVEGRLTKDWREERDTESADKLLSRADEAEETNKYKKRGKMTSLDDAYTYPLPQGWAWAQVGDVAKNIRYGTSEKATKQDSGLPMLRMGDISDGKLHFDDLKYLPAGAQLKDDLILEDGDVLFNRTNSAELVGKTAVYKSSHQKATYASYLVRAKLYTGVYNPDLLAYYINSAQGRQYIASVTSQQVGQANVNATKMSSMPLPIPPYEEQREIVNEVERLLSVADEATQTVEREIKRAERLRQSILKRAFSGQLVEKEKRSGKVGETLPLFDEEGTQQVQNKEANNALKNLRGQWPGGESIDELLDALD